MEKYGIDFIMWMTGDSAKTIKELYEQWLSVKLSPDFEEWHPELAAQIKELES